MAYEDWDILEKEYWEINEVLKRLNSTAKAKAVILIEKGGQLIASAGGVKDIDIEGVAALAAADFAAANKISELLKDGEVTELVHTGDNEGIYLSLVGNKFILIVIFSVNQTKLGLVRIRTKVAIKELANVFAKIVERLRKEGELNKIDISNSDSEIDDIFS